MVSFVLTDCNVVVLGSSIENVIPTQASQICWRTKSSDAAELYLHTK